MATRDETTLRLVREMLVKAGVPVHIVRGLSSDELTATTKGLIDRGILHPADVEHVLHKAAEAAKVAKYADAYQGNSAAYTTFDSREFGKWEGKKVKAAQVTARDIQQGQAGKGSRVGQPWHSGEDEEMLKAHAEGEGISTIAARHQRTPFAIACRLQKHKLLDDKMRCNQANWRAKRSKYGIVNDATSGASFLGGAEAAQSEEFTPIVDDGSVPNGNEVPTDYKPTAAPFDDARVKKIAEEVCDEMLATYDEAHSQERDTIIANLVRAEVAKQVKEVQVIAIARPDGTQVKVDGLTHYAFPRLLRAIKARTRHDGGALNLWLYGPAGTGKSTAARKLAGYLNAKFYTNGPVGSQWDIRGFTDASGKVVSTQFREAWINGGVYCWDEGDGSAPAALIEANGALATGFASFPDGVFPRHPECIIIINGNLRPGAAPDATYNGRFKQDTAFVNRFVAIEWGIDENLEQALLGDLKGEQAKWLQLVRRVRKRVQERGIKGIVISPRQAQYGVALLDAGADLTETTEQVIKFMFTDEQWQQVAA